MRGERWKDERWMRREMDGWTEREERWLEKRDRETD